MEEVNNNRTEIAKLEQRLQSLEDDRARNSDQHREFYNLFKKLEITDGKRETKQELILSLLNEIKADVALLKSKPVKRYEGIVDNIINWATVALLAYIATTIGA